MSVLEEDKIDFLSMDPGRGCVVLTIADHLEWQDDGDLDEPEDILVEEHEIILERKLETYFHFIESGQLLKAKPEYEGLPIVIQVKGMYPLNREAEEFYELARENAAEIGATLEFDYHPTG
jgi:hypothetical protein